MLRRAPFQACLTVLLALSAGCDDGSQNNNNTPPITSEAVGRSCNVDAECGGLSCHPVRRLCMCGGDGDCSGTSRDGAATPFCNNYTGLCESSVAGCKSDLECASGAYCDTRVRSCKPRKGLCEPCSEDSECGYDNDDCVLDSRLNLRFCARTCANGEVCPAQTTCQEIGGKMQCWPEANRTCKAFNGCNPDAKNTCDRQADCSDGIDQICDPDVGICVAREQVCPFGQVCDPNNKICVDACTTDEDCQVIASNLRCVDRACEPVGQCHVSDTDPTGDASCPPNRVCSLDPPELTTGSCVPFCSNDSECPQGHMCLRTEDNRNKCLPACRANSDCPPDKLCEKASGSAIGECKGTANQTCQATEACPTCAFCNPGTKACVPGAPQGYCKRCGTNADCGQGWCLDLRSPSGAVESRCGQPCPTTGCPRGFFCAEICVGGSYDGFTCKPPGQVKTACIPSDQSCNSGTGEKCR